MSDNLSLCSQCLALLGKVGAAVNKAVFGTVPEQMTALRAPKRKARGSAGEGSAKRLAGGRAAMPSAVAAAKPVVDAVVEKGKRQ